MRVNLLYPNREWRNTGRYYDYKSIINDLGLDIIFRTASREQIKQTGFVQSIIEADSFLGNTMLQVMMVPLQSEEEILYRQEILKDCVKNEQFIRNLYDFSTELMYEWERLGKNQNEKINNRNDTAKLVSDIHLMRMFIEHLDLLRRIIEEHESEFESEGLKGFAKNFREDYSVELERNIKTVLNDISFYVDGDDDDFERSKKHTKKARIILQCDIKEGLKLGNFMLQEVETLGKKYKSHGRKKNLMQWALGALAPESAYLAKADILLGETLKLEYQVVYYLMECLAPFMNSCGEFLEQLHIQSGFYRAAINIKNRMKRHELPIGYPRVVAVDKLQFSDLKDLSMAIEQLSTPVGNDCDISEKMLLIVTGANQGGKSTFLRSIGIAQIMMQAGLFVAAESFASGIFSSIFTHFTRREDSEMNSGRLDEELGRMSRIVDNLDKSSLVLLNESFATTTEKEGSIIAYDIIKALNEANVKVLTVTHLLSFAKQVYRENRQDVEFLSAERKSDGARTFKMIQHEPELTSFGLDLFEQVIKNYKEE